MSNTNHLDLLNKVQSMFIEHANANGINLAEKFATVQEFKDFIVGVAFKGLCDAGADVATAFNATVGEGQYEAAFVRFTA